MDGTHLIDGCMAEPHINALDVRTHNATLFGDGVYITDGLDGLPISVVDANTLSVGRGCMLVNGARITQDELLSLTIESGQQGLNRNDLLVGTYTYDGSDTRYEDVNLEIVTGTPTSGTAEDPEIHEGSLIDINNADLVSGVSTVQFPIARIPISGITVGDPVILAKTFQNVATLGDSVSPEKLSISNHIWAWRIGSLAVLNVSGLDCTISDYYGETKIATMPEGWRPKTDAFAAATTNDTPINVYLQVKESGSVYVKTTSGGDLLKGKEVRGQLVYTTA